LLHLGVLVENMRREGYELSIGKPTVIMRKTEDGTLLEPIEYHGGMFEDEDEQDDALAAKASLSALLAMLRAFVERDGAIELLPTWDGDEAKPPHGTIDKALSDLQPETWFFIERFLYRVTAGGA